MMWKLSSPSYFGYCFIITIVTPTRQCFALSPSRTWPERFSFPVFPLFPFLYSSTPLPFSAPFFPIPSSKHLLPKSHQSQWFYFCFFKLSVTLLIWENLEYYKNTARIGSLWIAAKFILIICRLLRILWQDWSIVTVGYCVWSTQRKSFYIWCTLVATAVKHRNKARLCDFQEYW